MKLELDLTDLGDACVETRQTAPHPMVFDSFGRWGWY